jgi:hypothetical protein
MAPSASATLLSARASVAALRRRTTTHARTAPLRRATAVPVAEAASSADGKGVVLITGANTGLGKRAALELSRAGYTVVGACRSVARGEAAAADIAAAGGAMEVMELDLNSFASVTAFASAFKAKHSRCDVLCNNAGIMVRACVVHAPVCVRACCSVTRHTRPPRRRRRRARSRRTATRRSWA